MFVTGRRIVSTIACMILAAGLAAAQGPAPAAPQLAWELGTVRGIKLRKGTSVDVLLRYTVRVPEGTAANYSLAIDVCRWVPVPGNIPDTPDGCTASTEVPLTELAEVEPGVFEGAVRYGYEPTNITNKRVNRYSFALNLRQVNAPDPTQVIARQEFNHIIFAGGKAAGLASGLTAPEQ